MVGAAAGEPGSDQCGGGRPRRGIGHDVLIMSRFVIPSMRDQEAAFALFPNRRPVASGAAV